MSFFTRIFSALGLTSGYVTTDRAQTRSMPGVSMPQEASKELRMADRDTIVAQARYFARNDPGIREAVRTLSLYAVGDGIRPQPCTSSSAWNRRAREEWHLFATRPEITKRFTMREVQAKICEALEQDGEIFILKTKDELGYPALQLIETQLVRTGSNGEGAPDGIEFDGFGRPQAYYIATNTGETMRVPARSVIHVANFERCTSTRGLPTLQHALPSAQDRAEMQRLTNIKAKKESEVVNVITRAKGNYDPAADELDDYGDGDDSGITQAARAEENDRLANNMTAQLGGVSYALDEGMDLKQLSNMTPGSTYIPYMEHLLTLGFMGVLPYGFINPEKLTGTAVRAVLAHTDRIISERQDKLIDALNQIWAYWVSCLTTLGILEARYDYMRVEWHTGKRITCDYGRDENADRENVKAGLLPVQEYYSLRGMDFDRELQTQIETMERVRKLCEKRGLDPAQVLSAIFGNAGGGSPAATPQAPAEAQQEPAEDDPQQDNPSEDDEPREENA